MAAGNAGMKFALTFGALSLVFAALAGAAQNVGMRIVFLSCAFSFGGVALAYAGLGPKTFLKRANGRLNPLSYVLFWPYHALNGFGLWLFRRTTGGRPYDKIAENLYLGGKLSDRDRRDFNALQVRAVLDLTCEFNETAFVQSGRVYFCLPLLDTQAPTLNQMAEAAAWLAQQAAEGAVYLHCALGHGHSATIAAAYLLRTGQADTVSAALQKIAANRPESDWAAPSGRGSVSLSASDKIRKRVSVYENSVT